MTNSKGDSISGRFSGNDRITQLKRNNDNFRKQSIGKYLPTLRKSKSIYTVPDEDTTNYLQIIAFYIDDPQYIADGFIQAVERYHTIGHYDEEIAAQKTAFDNSVQAQFKVLGNLIPMHILHDLLSNPPTDEANATTLDDGTQANVKVALYDRDTLATILTDMENSKIEVLPIVVDILKKLFFVAHIRDEEKIGGVYTPGENILFGLPKDAHATHVTNLATIVSNKGKFRKYCNFYGIKTVPFKAEMVTSYETVSGYLNEHIIGAFKYMPLAFRDGAATNMMYHATSHFNGVTQQFYFKDIPEEGDVDMLFCMKLFSTRGATYNLYGGLCIVLTADVQDNVNIVEIYQDDDTQGAANGFDGKTLTEDNVARLFNKFASSHFFHDATHGLAYTGTDLAADHIMAEPTFLIDNGYDSYGSVSYTILGNALLNWIGDKLQMTAVKKGGK